MAELTEIPLKLQLKEANHQIEVHLSKGRKFQQFLSPMLLWRFPAIMENHISVDWNTISGIYDRTPTLPITLIDTEILDDWFARPQVWDVSHDLQHTRCVLALIRYMLPTPYKGQPAIVFGGVLLLCSRLPTPLHLQDPGICGGCCEGQRRGQRSSRGGAGSLETSPEGLLSGRPRSLSPGRHQTSGPHPV